MGGPEQSRYKYTVCAASLAPAPLHPMTLNLAPFAPYHPTYAAADSQRREGWLLRSDVDACKAERAGSRGRMDAAPPPLSKYPAQYAMPPQPMAQCQQAPEYMDTYSPFDMQVTDDGMHHDAEPMEQDEGHAEVTAPPVDASISEVLQWLEHTGQVPSGVADEWRAEPPAVRVVFEQRGACFLESFLSADVCKGSALPAERRAVGEGRPGSAPQPPGTIQGQWKENGVPRCCGWHPGQVSHVGNPIEWEEEIDFEGIYQWLQDTGQAPTREAAWCIVQQWVSDATARLGEVDCTESSPSPRDHSQWSALPQERRAVGEGRPHLAPLQEEAQWVKESWSGNGTCPPWQPPLGGYASPYKTLPPAYYVTQNPDPPEVSACFDRIERWRREVSVHPPFGDLEDEESAGGESPPAAPIAGFFPLQLVSGHTAQVPHY
ncbi:hypothetical protein PLICRDRAFT_36804 [Plicaturopsis crispa FD-325 SS-3]|nr:hypothetical protein PLICRDRAFT_36804 [Plicaturopsis crispa FD-325 SS-3]